jgi:hypothetical protein
MFSFFAATAQKNQVAISGQVLDSAAKPIGYASVAASKVGSTMIFKSTYASQSGEFNLSLDTGIYILKVTASGYYPIEQSLHVMKEGPINKKMVMQRDVVSLQNINVIVRKPLVEQGDDKIIYNAESDPASKSESATDLLRKIPFVTVDGEGNIQLNGQGNFRILLNGRETSMFATNAKDALRSFPGAVISKIEVITAPSAKWDAEGVGGIINIITKKKVIGYNGYLTSYYSSLSNYVESASLNLKTGKLGFSGYISSSGSFGDIKTFSQSETVPVGPGSFSRRTLQGKRLGRNLGTTGNVEITYEMDSLNTIAGYGTLGSFRATGLLQQDIATEYISSPTEAGQILQDNLSNVKNTGIGADFIRKFHNRPDKELIIRINGQFSRNLGDNESMQAAQIQDRFVWNTSKANNKELTFQVDFVEPLKRKRKLEFGLKTILRKASSDYESLIKYSGTDSYKPNPLNSDLFSYDQQVYGAYSSYTFNIKELNFRSGIRLEKTVVRGDFKSTQTRVRQSYMNAVPNILITRKFSNTYTITGSYNLRLQRPYIINLNPFINNSDTLNISFGNPNLGPQTLHLFSIQNRLTKTKFFAAFTLNASFTNNMIVQYAGFDPQTGVTRVTYANFGREWQSGIGTNASFPLGLKLNMGFNAQLRYNEIENRSNILQNNKGISGSAFINFNYRLTKKFSLSGNGGVTRSPYALINSPSTLAHYQVNFGYKFLNEKLSVTMNFNNPHQRFMKVIAITESPDFQIRNINFNPYRVIYFGATYNFGKLKENISKKKGIANDDLVQ